MDETVRPCSGYPGAEGAGGRLTSVTVDPAKESARNFGNREVCKVEARCVTVAGFEPCLRQAVVTRLPDRCPRNTVRSLMLTFATKKLSSGANGQKEDAASFFFPRSFDRAQCHPVVDCDSDRKPLELVLR